MNIENALQAVDNLLLSVVDSSVSLLRDTTTHILQSGGKRLRPRLVLLAHAAVGGQNVDFVVPLAAAVEIIHTATLVHDDINDYGTLRRGRETVNSRWGNTFALLTGDYMFTKTYEIMTAYPSAINAVLAKAATELVEGETLQIQAAQNGHLDRAMYLEIIAKKTAALFVAAVELGAIAAHAPAEWINGLRQYAFNLGLAFQITDDILDLVANPEQIGKNAGIDFQQGRGLAVAESQATTGRGVTAPTAPPISGDTAPGPFKESLLDGNNLDAAVQTGREKARELAQLAAAGLDKLPPSPALDELRALTRTVIERDH